MGPALLCESGLAVQSLQAARQRPRDFLQEASLITQALMLVQSHDEVQAAITLLFIILPLFCGVDF